MGPDALGHEDIGQIVRTAVASGAERVRVDVDPVGIAAEGAAQDLLDAGVRHVRVPVLAGTSGSHDSLSCGPDRDQAIKEGIRAFTEAAERSGARVSVTVHIPVCRHNVQDLPAAVMSAAEVGAHAVLAQVADPGLDVANGAPWFAAACDTGMVNAVWVELEGVPFCLLPDHELHVANTVRACDGTKPESCGECAAAIFCDGVVPGAVPQVMASLARPTDHELLAERVRRSRTGVIA